MWVQVARMNREWRGLYDTRSQVHNGVLREDALWLRITRGERWQKVEKGYLKLRIFLPGNF